MVKTTLKPRAFAFIVSYFPTSIGKPGAIFSAHVNIRQTSSGVIWSYRDSARLRSPCREVGTRSVLTVSPRPLWIHATECCVCPFKSVPTWWLCGPIGPCAAGLSPARIFMLLLSPLLMLSGEIYLRLKPYLVVKISCDIVTEHCCQVCVLSMMFCRSDCRLCADMVVWLCNQTRSRRTMLFDLTPAGQRGI